MGRGAEQTLESITWSRVEGLRGRPIVPLGLFMDVARARLTGSWLESYVLRSSVHDEIWRGGEESKLSSMWPRDSDERIRRGVLWVEDSVSGVPFADPIIPSADGIDRSRELRRSKEPCEL